jgi:ligand-binding sensor domain-containing protein/DNA-binding CsgD family transcriptional regulator
MQKIGSLLLLLLMLGKAGAQNPIGMPNVINYARSDYNAGLQNRSITQDKNGIIYFANSEGLLSFDGAYWKLYPLPNQTIVRSVSIGKAGRIYAGGQNELGYFSPDKNGILAYTSLKNLLPEKARNFKDVWDIVPFDGKEFFRSLNHIFELKDHSILDSQPYSQWQFLGACGRELYAEDAVKGFFHYATGRWQPLALKGSFLAGMTVTAMLPFNKDSILVTSLKNGLFILSGNQLTAFRFAGENPLQNQLVLCAMPMDNRLVAVGTQLGGLYIIDQNGTLIQNLSRKEGLQNNTLLGLFMDSSHNLWMGLDDGIDCYAANSAIKHIYPERLNEGTGYSAIVFHKNLYIGTSNALYQLPLRTGGDLSSVKGNFNKIENTKGSVWGLAVIDGQLLMAHHEGAFRVQDNHVISLSPYSGYWNFTPWSAPYGKQILLAGNYNGLDEFTYAGKSINRTGNLSFKESSRFVVVEGNTAWVAHNYQGIYKVSLDRSQAPRLYTDRDGLPSLLKNRVFRIKGQMVAATSKGIYSYNPRRDDFEPSVYFQRLFGQKDLRYLKEDQQGNIWFIEGKKLGVADFSGAAPQLIYFPELEGKLVSDFENIYPYDQENIFIGAEKGFYHLNYKRYKINNDPLRVLISQVRANGDTSQLLNGGYSPGGLNPRNKSPELRYRQSNLHFEYAAPVYKEQPNIVYSSRLVSFDPRWSDWSKRTEKDYTNLPEGQYRFEVKARSNLGNESPVTGYSFTILPPWYHTWLAYSCYMLLFLAFNYWFYRWVKRKFRLQKQKYEQERARLTYVYQLEKDQAEKEIIALKNERLENEILGKNSELAAVAMHLLQKGELLTRIKEELVQLRKSATEMPSEELKRLTRLLGQESKMDQEWEQFAAYFDTTHGDFLKAIKEKHPMLSPHELKLCAYLRMNLSTKEIAQLLNISVRGVEVSRYRLRKKLVLDKETNIHSYFTAF